MFEEFDRMDRMMSHGMSSMMMQHQQQLTGRRNQNSQQQRPLQNQQRQQQPQQQMMPFGSGSMFGGGMFGGSVFQDMNRMMVTLYFSVYFYFFMNLIVYD